MLDGWFYHEALFKEEQMKKTVTIKRKKQTLKELVIEVWKALNSFSTLNLAVIIADLDKRSVNMNKFYFMMCNEIAKEEGRHRDAVHFDLKCLYLEVVNGESKLKGSINFREYGKMPESADLIPESKNLSKEDFKAYWQRVANLGNALHNMNLPLKPS